MHAKQRFVNSANHYLLHCDNVIYSISHGTTERTTKKILTAARDDGRVNVEKLSAHFSVSPQTIRKDLNELCDRQLLQRIHGGAIVGSGVENVSYEARRLLAPEAKRSIGIRAAQLIPNNCSLLINIGTTTEQVAHALKSHRGLMVISNNVNAIDILKDSNGIELIIAGGLVRRSDGGIIGDAAVDFINQFKADYAVIGVSAIDEDGALLIDFPFLDRKGARRLIRTYGKQAFVMLKGTKAKEDLGICFGSTLYEKEIRYLIAHEWAHTAEDTLWRRTNMGLFLSSQEQDKLAQ